VIRAVLVAALCFAPGVVLAKRAPAGDRRPAAPERWEGNLDLELPELPLLPGLPELDFSGIEIDLPGMLAESFPRKHGHDEDEDEEDNDDDVDVDRDSKAKIYKINPQRSIRLPRVHIGDYDDEDFEDRKASAQAKGRGTATLEVKGPVTFQVRAQGGEVEVVATDKRQVSVTLSDAPPEEITLSAFGDRVEPSFRGRRTLRRGKLRVELPRGSRLDLASMSGDVSAQRIADVRVRTMSGDVKLSGVSRVDVQTISGDARIEEAAGPVRLHTVSGSMTVATSGTAPQVEFQSASGSLDWSGVCAKDCHLSAETVSGDLRLSLDPKSSFELSYTSHSGELRDELDLAVKRAPRRKHGMASGWLEASYGKGEGVIEADAFSGSLVVKKK
jgi:putative adhesin